jgi:hypothetical protein
VLLTPVTLGLKDGEGMEIDVCGDIEGFLVPDELELLGRELIERDEGDCFVG